MACPLYGYSRTGSGQACRWANGAEVAAALRIVASSMVKWSARQRQYASAALGQRERTPAPGDQRQVPGYCPQDDRGKVARDVTRVGYLAGAGGTESSSRQRGDSF